MSADPVREEPAAAGVAIDPGSVTLAVIAKSPRPGLVKTRLCPPCTHDEAANIAMAALLDTFDAVAAATVGRRVVVLDGPVGPWIPEGFEVRPQLGDGLDERLGAAFDSAGGPMVIVGMDTPQVTAELLDEVVDRLCAAGTDGVLGHAPDGGYWVIGLREPSAAAVVGVPMSEATTGAAQARRLDELGLRITAVAELTDVDTFDEALEVAAGSPGGRFRNAVEQVAALGTPAPPD